MSVNVGVLDVFLRLRDEAKSGLDKFSKNFDDVTSKVEQTGRRFSDVGSSLSTAVSLPMAAIGGLSVKAASDFESSFAGVKKTVNATDKEFKIISDSIRQLAREEVPIDVNELNSVAEAAGQLGIAKGNIVGFTKTMADLSETTDLTSEAAATSIAQYQNIFGEAGMHVDRLGSTLVALGNAGASTESQILNMGLRIAGAGDQIGLAQGEVLAIASSLASVGIEAEAGGSAISKVMIDMALAVEKGGSRLDEFAQVAGVSSEEFKEHFERDAAGALTQFISGLGDMEKRGGSALRVLDSMEITEVRMRDALLRAAGAGDLLTESLQLQAKAWNENTALTEEAEKRYATFDSQLKFAKQRIQDIAITFGTALMPALLDLLKLAEPLIGMLAGAAEMFAALPTPIRSVVTVLGLLAIAAGPVIFVTGQLITAWGTVSTVAIPALIKGFNGIMSVAARLAAVNPLAWVAGGLLLVNELIKKWGELEEEQTVLNVELANSIGIVADLRKEYGKLTEAQLESAAAAIRSLQSQRESAFRERMALMDQIKAIEERNAKAKQAQYLFDVHDGDGSKRSVTSTFNIPEFGGGDLSRNKVYQDLIRQTKALALEEKNLANSAEWAEGRLEAHRQKLKENEKATKSTGGAVNLLTDEQKKLAQAIDSASSSITQNIALNKKIIAAIESGATEREIDDVKALHGIHIDYLKDVDEFGKVAADQILDLRLEEERTAKQVEKANLVLAVRNKHLERFDKLDKAFGEDVALDPDQVALIERAAELTRSVVTDEEARVANIHEAEVLLDKNLISLETYQRILRQNSTWILSDKTAWEKQLETIDRISVEVASWAGAFASLFEGFDQGVADALRGIGQIAEAWQAARSAQTTGEAIAAGMQMGQGVFQFGQGLGVFQGNRGVGSFGGQMSGDYSDIGAQLGGIIGTFIAPGIGTVIGAVLGGIIGSAIKMGADEGLAKLEEVGGEISVQIRKAEGGLGDPISKLGQGIKEAVEGILGAFGATLNELDNVWIKIRDDIITVTVGDIKARFDEIGDAISFAVAEILKQSDISGLSEVMRTVLENTTADSVEALSADLEFGQWYERLGFEAIVGNMRDSVIKFQAEMQRAAKLGLGGEPITEEFFRNFSNMRDQLLGIQRSPEEQLNRNIDAWERELKLMDAQNAAKEADLLIQEAELKSRLAIFEANRGLTENELLLRMAMLDAEYEIFNTQGSLFESLLESLDSVQAALEIVRGIREGIAGMGISEEERQEALRRLRSQRGGSGRTDQVGDFITDRTFELSLRGMSDYQRQMAELNRQYEDLLEQAGRDEAQRARLIALRERELELMRQAEVNRLVDSFREFLNLGNPFDQIRDTAANLIDEINDSPFGDARKANMIGRVMNEMNRQIEEMANQMSAGLLSNLISDMERFGAQESDMTQARIYMAMLEHTIKLNNYRRELEIIKLQGTMAPEIIAAMERAINFLSGIDPTNFIGGPANDNNRQLRGRALQDAIEQDRLMVAGGGKGPTTNTRDKARDLLTRYLGDLEDPLTESLNQINDDFALIIKELGNTPDILKAKNDAIQQAVDKFLEPLRQAQLDLSTGDLSVLDAQDKFKLLQDEFAKIQAAFAKGDLSVLKDAPSLLQDLLKAGAEINPIGSQAYKELFTAVNLFYQQVQDQIRQSTGTTAQQPVMTVTGMDRLSEIAASQLERLQAIGQTNDAMLANLRSINSKIGSDSGLRSVA